ncbi:MAG: hypothetical protein E6Y08_01925 [Paenibacillus sp.]|uniref:Uncharacterized protein n=1 Tax=Paenibacillus physcomitrellae TaxID=1619311 RepID=A0ABQ1GN51_9BACL|nr:MULTISPECIES: hypothetical protein [Paenibacillus]MDU4694548.1 hypothetical protein [Paenibacillus sp.]GGA46820.1 hypothetical protein GCM10010917_35100 [Paenibacillus physcomitrellae]
MSTFGIIIGLIIGIVLFILLNRVLSITFAGFYGFFVVLGICAMIGIAIVEWGIGFVRHHYIWTAIIVLALALIAYGAKKGGPDNQ